MYGHRLSSIFSIWENVDEFEIFPFWKAKWNIVSRWQLKYISFSYCLVSLSPYGQGYSIGVDLEQLRIVLDFFRREEIMSLNQC